MLLPGAWAGGNQGSPQVGLRKEGRLVMKTTACSTERRKTFTLVATVTAAVVFLAVTAVLLSANPGTATAQMGENGPGGGQGHPPGGPLMIVLDADEDGALSASEIENASVALLTLDADGNGALSEEELRPPRPEGSAPPARR